MERAILVFYSDFTYLEGAVSSMYGVVKSVDRALEIITGTHQIPQYDTWSASYRLYQSVRFWPKGTVFVCVVDPGVGTGRRASVAQTEGGYYIVSPDNGTLTHIDRADPIIEIREIDEETNRLRGHGTEHVAVFHGRDLFAYCAARLASGQIDLSGVGPAYPVEEIVRYTVAEPEYAPNSASGTLDICDPNFGNVWTNIDRSRAAAAGIEYGDVVDVSIFEASERRFEDRLPFHPSFGYAARGDALIYTTELGALGLASAEGDFRSTFKIGFGPSWRVTLEKGQS